MLRDHGVTGSMNRAGDVPDNSAMKNFLSSLKIERRAKKIHRTRDDVRADVFGHIQRSYNPRRRYSRLGYLGPMAFEPRASKA